MLNYLATAYNNIKLPLEQKQEITRLINNTFEKTMHNKKPTKIPQIYKEINEIRKRKQEQEEKHSFLEKEKELLYDEERKNQHISKIIAEIKKNQLNRTINRMERVQSSEDFQRFYQKYLASKPLYVVKEQEFHRFLQKTQHEQQSKVLKKLREIYKPHDLLEFKQHEKNYKIIKRQYDESRRERTKIFCMSVDRNRLWKGNCHTYIENELKRQSEEKIKQKQRIPMLKKSMEFYKIIKNSPEHLKIMKKKQYIKKNHSLELKKNNIMNEKMKKLEYHNYLPEIKSKNRNFEMIFENWKNDVKDEKMNNFQKIQRIKLKVDFMDNAARQKEQYLRYYKDDFGVREELNEILWSTINAKMALLKDF